MTYTWWDPIENKLASETLEGRSIDVSSAATTDDSRQQPAESSKSLNVEPCDLGISHWRVGVISIPASERLLGPTCNVTKYSEFIAANNVLKACRNNDAREAYRSLMAWKNQAYNSEQLLSSHPDLVKAWQALEALLFRKESTIGQWSGQQLELAFKQLRRDAARPVDHHIASPLPDLNP